MRCHRSAVWPGTVPSLAALALAACVTADRPEPAPDRLAATRSWISSPRGYVFRIAYFTDAELQDPVWEQRRLTMMRQVRFCHAGERIGRRDVRWYESTTTSGQRCAAVVYTVQCSGRQHAPGDRLSADRIGLLRADPEGPIESGCGEKDGARRPSSPATAPPTLHDLVSAEASCEGDDLPSAEPVQVGPETRIAFRTLVSPNLDVPGQFNESIARVPEMAVARWFMRAGRVAPHLAASAPADDGVNVMVTEAFAPWREHGYCVRLTARQGSRLWQETIRRAAYIEGRRAWVGVGMDGMSNDPARYWHPSTDAVLLSARLGSYLVANAAPDADFRRGWR